MPWDQTLVGAPGFGQGVPAQGGFVPRAPGLGQGGVGRGQARVFAIHQQDLKEAGNEVVTCMVLICSMEARVLFDSGATHSFIAPQLAKRVGKHAVRLKIPW